MESEDERAWVRAAVEQSRRGVENVAFSHLYQQHVGAVYRYLLANVGDHEAAQDLTAQTFLTALQQLERFRHEARFSTWLIGIARHKALDHHRRHRRPPVVLDETTPDPAPGLETQVDRVLQWEQVSAALLTLSPDRREAISLHIFAGLSVEEVAGVMNRRRTAVYALLERGLNDLRARLGVDKEETR